MDNYLSKSELKALKERGISEKELLSQLSFLKKGYNHIRLDRPCSIDDGIKTLKEDDGKRVIELYKKAADSGRLIKFVPASGAATRMFKSLSSFCSNELTLNNQIDGEAKKDIDQFIGNIKKFAFYDDINKVIEEKGKKVNELISQKKYGEIISTLLNSNGLNYNVLPKGLIKFHLYENEARTAFEEHLAEATNYITDNHRVAKIHFTIADDVDISSQIKKHIDEVSKKYEKRGIRLEITFSSQKPSTDTIAIDLNGNIFKEDNGHIHLRPGGHGALLENLNDLKGDLVYIRNIDNIAPEREWKNIIYYKMVLCGYLIEIQNKIFEYVRLLSQKNVDTLVLTEIHSFVEKRLYVTIPKKIKKMDIPEQSKYLYSLLNRPIRVCGVVKNQGEPGGGPFWVKESDDKSTLQIVESSQVDMTDAEQKMIWDRSTHFNPVDIVCGLRDYNGEPFDLTNFSDKKSGFISRKFKNGRELIALELPGLWNGAMANWNTIFVEVPVSTFNPVKTIFDLLRREHQP